jgi:hypothetical protein
MLLALVDTYLSFSRSQRIILPLDLWASISVPGRYEGMVLTWVAFREATIC